MVQRNFARKRDHPIPKRSPDSHLFPSSPSSLSYPGLHGASPLSPSAVLQLQRTIGNQAVQQLLTQRKTIQRAVIGETDWGTWKTLHYDDPEVDSRGHGIEIQIQFNPNEKVNATKIGFIQAINWISGGKPVRSGSKHADALIQDGEGLHSRIDRGQSDNPVYASTNLKATQTLKDSTVKDGSDQRWQGKYTSSTNRLGKRTDTETEAALMYDRANFTASKPPARQFLETTAIALDGPQAGTYYGSIGWGWENLDGKSYKKIQPHLVSLGQASHTFFEAAKAWNKYKKDEPHHHVPLPTTIDDSKNKMLTYGEEIDEDLYMQAPKKKKKDGCLIS